MARSIPKVREGFLQQHSAEDTSTDPISIGTAAWYSWLEQHHSFTFETPRMTFTARKEQRPGGWYWYAYRRSQGKLHSRYLGKSEELTPQRLDETAAAFEQEGGAIEGKIPRRLRASRDKGVQAHRAPIIPLPTRGAVAESLSEPVPRHNLPVQLTPLIGREQDIASAVAHLHRPEVRLLTLTGPGGVGKTRLALQVAADLLEDFADGVSFVSLAAIREPDLVLPTLAQAFELKETPSWLPLEHLKAFLHDKRLLLLLDNFEQVNAAAPLLVELLQACPELKMLVTSRLRLRVSGEYVFPVHPLAVPDPKHLSEDETLLEYAAVALFVQRAQAIKPDFQLTTGNARTIAEICRHLDGLPLALELAAARIKLLSPQALLARLSHRLQVLTGGVQDAPLRQQTLRNTLAWSYDLLSAGEQRLFRWLSVFVGGCTLEVAEAVCQAHRKDGEQPSSVLEGVASLLDKSLLQQTEREGKAPRLFILETIREFGLECLEQHGELQATQQAHAGYYLKLAEETKQKLKGTQQGFWLDRLEQEHDNLRAALRWLVEQKEVEVALRLVGALSQFWLMHGHLREGRQWLEGLLFGSRRAAVSPLGLDQADIAAARAMAQEFLALGRELGDQRIQAYALTHLGFLSLQQGEVAVALPFLEESLGIFKALGDREGIGYNSLTFGWFSLSQSDPVAARLHFKKSLKMMIEINNKWFTAASLEGLAMTAALNAAGESIESALWAARLWGTADALRAAIGVPLRSYERAFNEWGIASVRTRLGEEAFAAAWQEGRMMAPEQVLAAQGSGIIPPGSPEESVSIPPTKTSPTSPAGLTAREVEVLRLVAQGMTSPQIAKRLILSAHTVHAHVRSIYTKLDVNSRSSVTRYAIEQHLL